MKIIRLGKQHTRYALIVMLLDKPNGKSLDDKVTYYNSNNLDELLETHSNLLQIHNNYDSYLEMKIFDYQEMKYVRCY